MSLCFFTRLVSVLLCPLWMYVIVLPVEHLYYLVTFQVAETLSFKCPKYSMLHLYFKKTFKKKRSFVITTTPPRFWWKLITGLRKKEKRRHHRFMASTLYGGMCVKWQVYLLRAWITFLLCILCKKEDTSWNANPPCLHKIKSETG